MATYKGEAPGDSPELKERVKDTFITDPILKTIILEVFSLIVAIFIILMFLIVSISGITAVLKSFYLYRLRPYVRKKIKTYKRYRKKMHTTYDANSSSSSSTTDSDVSIIGEQKQSKKDETVTIDTDSTFGNSPMDVSHQNLNLGIPKYIQNLDKNYGNLDTRQDQGSLLGPLIQASSSHYHEHPHHHHVKIHSHIHSQIVIESGLSPVEQKNNAVILPVNKPKLVKRMKYVNVKLGSAKEAVMPEHYKHLRRGEPGPAQKVFLNSPDVDIINDAKDVPDENKISQIVVIHTRQRVKKKKFAEDREED